MLDCHVLLDSGFLAVSAVWTTVGQPLDARLQFRPFKCRAGTQACKCSRSWSPREARCAFMNRVRITGQCDYRVLKPLHLDGDGGRAPRSRSFTGLSPNRSRAVEVARGVPHRGSSSRFTSTVTEDALGVRDPSRGYRRIAPVRWNWHAECHTAGMRRRRRSRGRPTRAIGRWRFLADASSALAACGQPAASTDQPGSRGAGAQP